MRSKMSTEKPKETEKAKKKLVRVDIIFERQEYAFTWVQHAWLEKISQTYIVQEPNNVIHKFHGNFYVKEYWADTQ